MGIHACSDSDIEEILFVINESNRTHYKDIIPPEFFREPVLSLDEMKEQMKRMSFYYYETDGRIVGVAALEEKTKGLGQVHWVYVLPDYQRKRVGTSLMRFIESEALRRDLNELMVVTSEKAVWARTFYMKLDFEMVESVPTPEGGIVTFRKVLTRSYSN